MRADMIILNTDHPVLAGRSGDAILDTWIFAGGRAVIKDVFAAGHRVVCEGRHWDEDASRQHLPTNYLPFGILRT